MPQHYSTSPAPLERTRCIVTRTILSTLLYLIHLASRLLPTGHPTRLFIAGRLPELRKTLLPATIASSRPPLVAELMQRQVWIVTLVVFALAVLGDVSAGIPFDPFGLPDAHLGIGPLLGFGDDSLLGTAHIFGLDLPWNNESPAGATLLVSVVACVVALWPSHWRKGLS